MLIDFKFLPLFEARKFNHLILFNFLEILKAGDISKCFEYFSDLFVPRDSCIKYFIKNSKHFNMQGHLDKGGQTYFSF